MPTPSPPGAKPSLAPHYERLAIDRQLKDGRWLAAVMGLGRGHRVLELGCGIGLLSEHLARRVGLEGEVLGLDALPLRVHIAHQERACRNLRFQVGHVDQLARFGPGSFDAIVANGLLHTWPEAGRALAECARLLAPGGRLGLVTHDADHPHPARVAMAAVLALPAYAAHPLPPEAHEYPLTQGQLRDQLREAGFEALLLEAQAETCWHASAEGAIEAMQASAWSRFLQHLPQPLRAAAHDAIVARLEARREGAGIRQVSMRLMAIACRPLAPPAVVAAATDLVSPRSCS